LFVERLIFRLEYGLMQVLMNYFFPDSPFHLKRHVICTTLLIGLAMAISLVTEDLGIILELAGSTSACALAYILPPLCYIKYATKIFMY